MQELCNKTKEAFDLIAERLRNASVNNGSVAGTMDSSLDGQKTNNNNIVREKQADNHLTTNGQMNN